MSTSTVTAVKPSTTGAANPANHAAFEAAIAAAKRRLLADVEAGNGAGAAAAASTVSALQQKAAAAAQALVNGVVDGGAAIGKFAQESGSAAYTKTAAAAGTTATAIATAAGAAAGSPPAKILALGLGASFATLRARQGKLIPGLGAGTVAGAVGVAGAAATQAIYGETNYYPIIAAGLATGLANGINVGIPKPAGFDAAALDIGGNLGVYAANGLRNGLTVAVAGAIGLAGHAITAKLSGGAKSGSLPANLQDLVPPPNSTQISIPQGHGRGLTEVPSTAEQKSATDIYNAASSIWQSWMANPTIKAQITHIAQTPSGAGHVVTQLYNDAVASSIATNTQTQLADFKKTDPAGYTRYIAEVTASGGPNSQYAQSASQFQQTYQSANTLIQKDLTTYVAQNPTGSLNDFYSTLSSQDKTTLQGYFATMNTAYAGTNHAAAEAAYDYLDASGQETDPSKILPGSSSTTASSGTSASSAVGHIGVGAVIGGILGGAIGSIIGPEGTVAGAAIGIGLGGGAGATTVGSEQTD